MIQVILAGLFMFVLICFILKQKKIKRKLDAIILVCGAVMIMIIDRPLNWIAIFLLVSGYFLINGSRRKSAQNR